uniref:RpoH protein n=1 Tax=Cupriavidus metallidurans TaxID=119219 RepID=Q9X2J5_9BURK|nr:RpoH protein [Cupriavidus metallidurans CH34]
MAVPSGHTGNPPPDAKGVIVNAVLSADQTQVTRRLPTAPQNAAANAFALTFPGTLGNLDSYIQAVHRIPMLTPEEELSLARDLRDNDSVDAARRMVMSHLRLVVSIARQYLGYGLPHADLIQEGNIGLMKAVKRFDPEQACAWCRTRCTGSRPEIHEYVLKNWRMVKVATTKAQRKLFFNLRSHKQGSHTFTPEQIEAVARELNVKPEEVMEMETRMSGGDMALEGQIEDGEEEFAPIAYLADNHNEPTQVLEAKRRPSAGRGPGRGADEAGPAQRRIIEARWLDVNDDGSGGARCTNWPTSSVYPPSGFARSNRRQ